MTDKLQETVVSNEEASEIIQEVIKSSKKNIVLDATVLSSLMTCGRFADLRFNHHLVPMEGKSNSLEVGSVVHKVLETFYKNKINGFDRTTCINLGLTAGEMYVMGCPLCTGFIPRHPVIQGDEYRADVKHTCHNECILKPTCNHEPNEYPGVENTPPDSAGYRIGWKYALNTCEQYFEYYKNDHWVPLEVEVVKGTILFEDDEIRILWKAKLDLTADTNQGIFPVDHKTMKQRRVTQSLNNQFMGQCLTMKTRNVFINKIGFQTSLKPNEKFERVAIGYTAERLIEWQSEILPYWAYKLIEYNESGYWPPNFSNCETKFGMCQYAEDICSANPDMRAENLRINFKVGPEWNPSNVSED